MYEATGPQPSKGRHTRLGPLPFLSLRTRLSAFHMPAEPKIMASHGCVWQRAKYKHREGIGRSSVASFDMLQLLPAGPGIKRELPTRHTATGGICQSPGITVGHEEPLLLQRSGLKPPALAIYCCVREGKM